MIVAGGVYHEHCVTPHWDRLFGSGGRAAAVLAGLGSTVRLHAYVASAWAEDVRSSFESQGVSSTLIPIPNEIGFRYFHPMSTPQILGLEAEKFEPFEVTGDTILRFGMLEGSAIVHGERVVYDPQNWSEALSFAVNGSSAKELALVLNESELEGSTNRQGAEAAACALQETGATVLVVKRGAKGATVYHQGSVWNIPAFRTDGVFKIGSGDVFSAVFARAWGEDRLAPNVAARKASEAVATYVGSRDLGRLSPTAPLEPTPLGDPGRIYLAGPFFTLAQRWLIEEANEALACLGAPVFSPFHEVGMPGDADLIAAEDLAGLRDCAAVLALVDGEDAGTLFEVGYARARDIPVVVFSESPAPESLTMLVGSGCDVTGDFATALYRAFWAATR